MVRSAYAWDRRPTEQKVLRTSIWFIRSNFFAVSSVESERFDCRGVVHNDVDATESFNCLLHGVDDRCPVTDVADNRQRVSASRFDLRGCR
jgi:hypothetical protein